MKVVFFGTPEFVLPVLNTLHKKYRERDGTTPIAAVVTQAPKPAGRKKELKYSTVDEWAYKRSIPKFFTPHDLIGNKIEADLGVVAAYGEIIPARVIGLFPNGILNIHPSLLPKYRGSSPIPAAIASGDKETGVTIMKMDELMDHGPIVTQFRIDIEDGDTTKSLVEKSFIQSADVLIDLIPAYLSKKVMPKKQIHEKASYTTLLKKEHGFIPFEYLKLALDGKSSDDEMEIGFVKGLSVKPGPETLHNLIRALDPWPGAWTEVKLKDQNKRMKIIGSKNEDGKLVILEVQLEGKNPITWKQFKESYPTLKL